MDNYLTGNIIKELREKQNLTQSELARILSVSDKTISKWETGRGLPDITLIEPLARALNISVAELMNGKYITNANKSANLTRAIFKVCPICGNVLFLTGECVTSCCGVVLPPLYAENETDDHKIEYQNVENELYVTVDHDMTKSHYISFVAYVKADRCEIAKMYPEQNAEARFLNRGKGILYVYCNQDGLYKRRMK